MIPASPIAPAAVKCIFCGCPNPHEGISKTVPEVCCEGMLYGLLRTQDAGLNICDND